MLILAGVTIATLTGDNGLLNKAGQAKTATEESEIKEQLDLLIIQLQMGDKIEDVFGSENVNKEEGSSIYKVKYKNREYLFNSDYEIIDIVEPAYDGEWTFDENTKKLTAYNGNLDTVRGSQDIGEVIIPNYYNGIRVKEIGKVFASNKKITKLKISEGIEKIADEAFRQCTNLTGDINIPNSVTSIGYCAFAGNTAMEGKINLGKNVETICSQAFSGCVGLTGDLIIPDSVKTIGSGAFYQCISLNGSLKLSNNMTSIEASTFNRCDKLTGDLIIPDGIESIGEYAFYHCGSLDGNLKLGKNLVTIDKCAFDYCGKLKGDVILSDTVTSIGMAAFEYCASLDSIKILNSQTAIDSSKNVFKLVKKIIGYEGSTAQTYANDNNIPFQLIT